MFKQLAKKGSATSKIVMLMAFSTMLSACGGSSDTTPASYTVSTSTAAGGTISPDSRTVTSGQTTSFTITPNTGYSIATVSGCNGSLNGTTYTTGAISSACTVTASFNLNSYMVTASAGEGGGISPASVAVNHGATTSFDITVDAGYGIAEVTGCNGSLTGNTYTTGAITAACAVNASFNFTLNAPQNLMVTASDAELTFNWQSVNAATSYNLYYDIEPNIDIANYTATNTGMLVQNVSSPYSLTGLSNGTAYYAVLTAAVGGAESNASNEVTATPLAAIVATSGLNDTGIDWCSNARTNRLDCPVAGFAGQDAAAGRDAQARTGSLSKVGGGAAGFDFTKLDANGIALPEDATAWSCVRDNHTGLIWEVKTNDGGLRDSNHLYTWYDPDSSSNGGNAGSQNGGICVDSACDTHGFIQAVNSIGLCGANDWRLPTRLELMGIVHNGRSGPTIDNDYFSNTEPKSFWSSSNASSGNFAWVVYFGNGDVRFAGKSGFDSVRLVRSEP